MPEETGLDSKNEAMKQLKTKTKKDIKTENK
jgi:hypothetical protein